MLHALIVDDDTSFQNGLAEAVRLEGFTATTAMNLQQAREQLADATPDVLFVDLSLPDGNGLDLLEGLEAIPETVLITGQASVGTAVQALRKGVADYLTKPVDFSRVKSVLGQVARAREFKEEIFGLRGELRKLGRFGGLVGAAPVMQEVYDLISKVAKTDATILITGETGTGKEVVAQTIHELSRRRREPFLPLNCGAVSPNVIESELFGHERGSFTGAERSHKGHFERASKGTLFLDEITEMPLDLQVRLLRVIETSELIRVGGSESIKVNVRLVAATNQNPDEAVRSNRLREDLLYRLNVFPIHLPRLAERREDIELLTEHFLAPLNKTEGTHRSFSRAAKERLHAHDWPGNVRELKNVIQRAFILAEDKDEIGPDLLSLAAPLGEAPPPMTALSATPGANPLSLDLGISLPEVERRVILATLDHFGGDKKKTAEALKISVKKIYNRLREYRATF
jgi:two-component system response regulator AtoC